jgi:hypothetical protein
VTSTGSAVDIDLPNADELEISLFGPGYGESLALHLGNGQWMIVDSCVDSSSRRAAALGYLDFGCPRTRQRTGDRASEKSGWTP